MRLACTLLVLCASLAGESDPAPRLRVESGAARVAGADGARSVDRRAGEVELEGMAYVEAGAHTRLALVWRGAASATVEGPAAFEVGPARLALADFRVAEVEVRRGRLDLELAHLGRAELQAGAVQLRALPDGVVELLNRGGAALELQREGEKPLSIPPGERVRVRASG